MGAQINKLTNSNFSNRMKRTPTDLYKKSVGVYYLFTADQFRNVVANQFVISPLILHALVVLFFLIIQDLPLCSCLDEVKMSVVLALFSRGSFDLDVVVALIKIYLHTVHISGIVTIR